MTITAEKRYLFDVLDGVLVYAHNDADGARAYP